MARLQARPPTGIADAALDFPLCHGDFPFRLQRALGLIPARGLGVGRRAVVAVLVTWVPMAIAAASAGRFLPDATGESLVQHFGVNAKFLVAVPLLIIGETLLETLTRKKIPHFVESGLVTEADRPHFRGIVEHAVAWRDAWQPWLVIAVLIATWTLGASNSHDLLWAAGDPPRRLALQFGAWWYIWVGRPIFIALVLIWLWRLTVLAALLWRISRPHVVGGDVAEVLDLRRVEIRLQLPVGPEEPPAAGQLQREVAAALPCRPAGEPAPADRRAEQPREGAEPVVPVVIARDREDVGSLRGTRVSERGFVRRDQPALVRLAARRGVHLVATEDEEVAANGRVPASRRALEFQDRLRRRVGDGVDRVPAVARIAHVVDPDLLAEALTIGPRTGGVVRVVHRVVVERGLAGRDRLDEAWVGALSHHERGELHRASAEELGRIEPPDHGQPLSFRARPPEQREAATTVREAPRDGQGVPLAGGVRGAGRVGGRRRRRGP